MENNRLTNNQYENEIDITELFSVLWAGKLSIIIITTIFAIGSIFYALSLPNQYKASVLIAPAQQDSGGLSSSINSLGGLASLAGINIGSNKNNTAYIAKEIMVSRNFIENFIKTNNISDELGAVLGWDEENNKLVYNQNDYDIETQTWISNQGAPSSWMLYKSFKSMLVIEQELDTIRVSLEHYSPYFAKELLDLYIKDINKILKKALNSKSY